MSTQLMKFLEVGDSSFEVCDAAARAGMSSAVPVSTAASMTDTTKIYLYLGSESGYQTGHWYYYNGSTWVDGGQFLSASLSTSILTATLEAGQTTVTFTDSAILADSLIDVYADVWFTACSQSAGSFSLTFPVQSSDMTVKVRIS